MTCVMFHSTIGLQKGKQMNRKKCEMCGEVFDFDTGGFGVERPSGEAFVCSETCAKRSAYRQGKKYAIHDKTDAIVETNASPQELAE